MTPRRIMLVEDNADDRELARRALARQRAAKDLVVVEDGADAIDYLFCEGRHAGRHDRAPPHVILLDINLPRLDGHAVLRIIRADQRTRNVPVVMLSSSDEEKDIATSYALGANSYVRKPDDFSQFAEAIDQIRRYWLTLNRTGDA